MNFIRRHFVDVKHGTKTTYSESDLRKLDRTYENEVIDLRDRRVKTPMQKVPQQAYLTQLRDYAYEKILDSHMYTFGHLLVIPNPYDIVKQSALLLFNSSQETKIRYRVVGDVPETDFIGETEYTTRHRVPILGLYLERSNRLELEMIDHEGEVVKRRDLRIYVSDTPKKIRDVLGENITSDGKKVTTFPFLLINGVSFNPLVVDIQGKIRYSIQLRTNSIGMIPIGNGHFLYEDRTANRKGGKGKVVPCRYHEMDYMGRIYRTYLLDMPLSGAVTQSEESFFMVTSSDEEHIMDKIVEIDQKSGKLKQSCEMTELFGDGYRTKEDWVHISTITFCRGKLVVVLKRLHTVFEFVWETKEIVWVLAPELIWQDNPVKNFLLSGDRPNESVCFKPDFAAVYDGEAEADIKIGVFQFKANGDVPIFPEDGKDSDFVFLRINEEEKRFQTLSEYSYQKISFHGSAFFSKNEKELLLCSGILAELVEGKKGRITEFDRETGKEMRNLYTTKAINSVWEFEPNIASYGESVPVSKDVIFGTLKAPEIFEGKLPEISEDRIERQYFSTVLMCEELFISSILPGSIDRIYFVGETHAYVQDYSDMIKRNVKFPFVVSLHDFGTDTYYVYVEREGIVHPIKNEIRVIAENDL